MNSIPQHSIEKQGGLFAYHVPCPSRPGGGQRGDILPWMSSASRRRMARTISRIDWASLDAVVHFVTLTLSPHYWDQPGAVKRALKRFRQRLSYHLGKPVAGLWRREVGQGGNLHYHLLLIGVTIPENLFKRWVLVNWSMSCKYAQVEDRKTDYLRVDVQETTNTGAVARYLGKYISKACYELVKAVLPGMDLSASLRAGEAMPEGAPSLSKAHTSRKRSENAPNTENTSETWGKHWGIWGADQIPWADKTTVTGEAVREVAVRVKRTWRKYLRRDRERSIQRKLPSFYQDQPLNSVARRWRIRELHEQQQPEVCPDTGEVLKSRLPFYEQLRLMDNGFTVYGTAVTMGRLVDFYLEDTSCIVNVISKFPALNAPCVIMGETATIIPSAGMQTLQAV